jgi:hypothetical protein
MNALKYVDIMVIFFPLVPIVIVIWRTIVGIRRLRKKPGDLRSG